MASNFPPTGQSSFPPVHQLRRDKPWLLPSNRKLRHLTSISLRNLSLYPTDGPPSPTAHHHRRSRGRTIVDDDAVPTTLSSPAKRVAMRELRTGSLEHSRSSEDLRADAASSGVAVHSIGNGTEELGALRESPGKRPSLKKMRRRSTLEWVHATPQRRQERLESVVEERLGDWFFVLGVVGLQEPIYVSETVPRTMNPTFRHVDLSACGPGITRLDRIVVKVWVRPVRKDTAIQRRWRQFMEVDITMRNLHFLGRSLDSIPFPLPTNALLLHLPDGVYTPTPLLSLPQSLTQTTSIPSRQNSARPLPTSTYPSLLRLAKLDTSIQDALNTTHQLTTSLNALFTANSTALAAQDEVAEAEDRVKTIEYAAKTVRKQVEKALRQLEERRAALSARREVISADREARHAVRRRMEEQGRKSVESSRSQRTDIATQIRDHRRRVCRDLEAIFPITPIPGKSLAFKIRGIELPNADALDEAGVSPENVGAALGLASHVVLLLSFYLHKPVPYPLSPRGSGSTILDPTSLLPALPSGASAKAKNKALAEKLQRTYPLFRTSGVPRFRFEYALFLLNKDLQVLLEDGFGVRVLDVRQTLPNLVLLLYVATAGEGELPGRKAGGVRGLVRAREREREREREGSVDSDGSSTLVGSWGSGVGGKGKQNNGSLKGGKAAESLRGFIGTQR